MCIQLQELSWLYRNALYLCLNIILLTVIIKVRGVEDVIMSQVEDVVLQQSLVMKERVTVMVLMMVDNMMDMMAVKAP